MSKVVTPSVYTDSHAGAIPAPPLRHAHDAAAARDDNGGEKRDYAWLSRDFCDTCFQPLSFKSRSESASRGSNPPGAANTILRKSFVKSLNERVPNQEPYSLYRCLVRTKFHKARQKAAGSALSVKLEKYLSRPDYEGHISLPRVECHEQISFPQGDPRRQRQFRRQQGSRIASPITMRGTMI